MIEEKLDQLLQDVAIVKTKLDLHAEELHTLQERLDPVFYHVNGVRWAMKLGASLMGVLACVATVAALFR